MRPPENAGFLNVDLEIRSRAKLDLLGEAWGDAVVVLYSGPEGPGKYLLNLELSFEPSRRRSSPDAFIRAFCGLVERLSPAARRLWDRARKKTFDVGWEEAGVASSSAFAITPATLERVAALGATLAVTFYHRREKPARKGARPPP